MNWRLVSLSSPDKRLKQWEKYGVGEERGEWLRVIVEKTIVCRIIEPNKGKLKAIEKEYDKA